MGQGREQGRNLTMMSTTESLLCAVACFHHKFLQVKQHNQMVRTVVWYVP